MDHIHYRPHAAQTVAMNNSTFVTTTQFFDARVKLRVVTSVDAWVHISTPAKAAPAVGVGTFMPAGAVEYFHCRQGDLVAGITDSATTGYLNVSELIR